MFTKRARQESADIREAVQTLNAAHQITRAMPVNSFLKVGDGILLKVQAEFPSDDISSSDGLHGVVRMVHVMSCGPEDPTFLIPSGKGTFKHQNTSDHRLTLRGHGTANWICSEMESITEGIHKGECKMIHPKNAINTACKILRSSHKSKKAVS